MTRILIGSLAALLLVVVNAVHADRAAAQACNTDNDCVNASCSPTGQCVAASEAGASLGAPVTATAPVPVPPQGDAPIVAPQPTGGVVVVEQGDLPPPPPAPVVQTTNVPPAGEYPGQYPGQYQGYSGVPQPSGYETVSRPRKGLIISGAITFGVPWVLMASASYLVAEASGDDDVYLGMIPVAGPLFILGQSSGGTDAGPVVGMVLLSLAQAAGLTMFTLGFVLTSEEQVPVYQTAIVVPTLMGTDGGGLVAAGTF